MKCKVLLSIGLTEDARRVISLDIFTLSLIVIFSSERPVLRLPDDGLRTCAFSFRVYAPGLLVMLTVLCVA